MCHECYTSPNQAGISSRAGRSPRRAESPLSGLVWIICAKACRLTLIPFSVTKYDVPTGILTVKHHYPYESTKPAKTLVDINLLLEVLNPTDIVVGAWINIFGYVVWSSHSNKSRVMAMEKATGTGPLRRSLVKALMIHSAGTIDVGKYERVLSESMQAKRELGVGD